MIKSRDSFDFSFDVKETGLEDAVNAVTETPSTPTTPEITTTQPPATPETSSEPTPETPAVQPKQRPWWVAVALSLQKTDKFIDETVEIPEDLTIEGFKTLLWESGTRLREAETAEYVAQKEAEALKNIQEKGYTDAHLAYAAHLAAGGTPETVRLHAQYQLLANANLDTTEKQIAIIKADAQIRQQDPDMIEAYVASLTTPEAIEAAAVASQRRIGEKAYQIAKEDSDRIETKKREAEAEQREWEKNIKAQISKGFMGIKLDKFGQERLADFFTKPTEVRSVATPMGYEKQYMTLYEATMEDIENNIEQLLSLGHFIQNGMTGLVNAAHKAASDDFMKGISAPQGESEKPQPQPLTKIPSMQDLRGRSKSFTIEV